MQISRTAHIFWGLVSDFDVPIPNDIIDELLENIPEVLTTGEFSGNDIHIPYLAKDGKYYYHVFTNIKMCYGFGTPVGLPEVPLGKS